MIKSKTHIHKEVLYLEDRSLARNAAGDLYLPVTGAAHPVLIAVHGGGWQRGSKAFYSQLGPFLAERGIAVFAIDYRLATDSQPSYPCAVEDVVAALAFVRNRAKVWNLDAARIGIIGDSAGAHLAALVTLNGAAHAAAHSFVQPKVCIGVYGVYDLAAQWEHDLVHRPANNMPEKFLGKPLYEDRKIYFRSSPLSYATTSHNKAAFVLAWGTDDDFVRPDEQSKPFLLALGQAGFVVRTKALRGASHFWISDRLEGGPGVAFSFASFLADTLPDLLKAGTSRGQGRPQSQRMRAAACEYRK